LMAWRPEPVRYSRLDPDQGRSAADERREKRARSGRISRSAASHSL